MAVGGSYNKGETIRATFTCTPASGTISLSDVSLTIVSPAGVETDVSASVTGPSTNVFRLDYAIPADADDGDHVLVFQVSAPSSECADEIAYQVLPTAL